MQKNDKKRPKIQKNLNAINRLCGLGLPKIIWASCGTNNVKKDFQTLKINQIW